MARPKPDEQRGGKRQHKGRSDGFHLAHSCKELISLSRLWGSRIQATQRFEIHRAGHD
jgi:hypothetical protein